VASENVRQNPSSRPTVRSGSVLKLTEVTLVWHRVAGQFIFPRH
jgi:hypothetical protein